MGKFFNEFIMKRKKMPHSEEAKRLRRTYAESIRSTESTEEGIATSDGRDTSEPKPDVRAKPKVRKKRVGRPRKSTVK